MFNVVRHVVGNHQEAEDLVQETFVQAFVKLETFQGASAFYTWLYRIAFNLSVSSRRRMRPEVSVDQRRDAIGTEPIDRGEGPEERLARQERVRQVQAALASLSEEYRTILVLREIDGCDYDTLGEILDLPIGTVRSRLHRARTELRERRPLYGVSEDPQAWNYGNVQSAGGCCLVVGDKLYFYAGGTKWGAGSFDPNHTGLAILRRDGFSSLDAGETEGSLTTRPLRFTGRHLFVNVAAPQGTLRAEVLDAEGRPIAPFTADNCPPVSADNTKTMVPWTGVKDLSALIAGPYACGSI